MHVSLITSLYRTEQHLPKYIESARAVAQQVQATGLTLELILVANDATEGEKKLLDKLVQTEGMTARVLNVPRESLYASWNRGVQAARGEALGFWNVDDVRTPEAIIEGYRRIESGCSLVYFSHEVIRTGRSPQRRVYPAVPYDPEHHRRVMKCGPFFMFAPALYEQVGRFDEHFRIVGDWEWCIRAIQYTDFCPVEMIAGTFYLHGGNLSDTGNPLQLAEENMVRLLHQDYERLIPVEPEMMRKTWEKWAMPLPPEIEELLWGAGVTERAVRWQQAKQRERLRQQLGAAIRYLPKRFIDRTGLRSFLAKLGLVKKRS